MPEAVHTEPQPLRERTHLYLRDLQERICRALEEIDGSRVFTRDAWDRPEGGGGFSRVLQDGAVFEKAGVNTSAVHGMLTPRLAGRMGVEPAAFFAAGISLVVHPQSPMVPTVHMNLRYFELETGDRWFGGGTDLTPSYPYTEDILHFHRTLRYACEMHGPDLYPRYKRWCDEYFFIRHRGEARGVGGLFFDYLRDDLESHFAFARTIGDVFLETYTPIVNRRIREPYGDNEKNWQLFRRGRYVEFNLVYDRGTLFGLETNGRVESILMSLPPSARWDYDPHVAAGSREAALQDILRTPRDWLAGGTAP